MVYVIHFLLTVCQQDQYGTCWSCSQAVSKSAWHIPLLCVQWKTPDDGQRNCPKHVEFYSKNKFEKSVHLVGFIIRIFHDARSPERQNNIINISTSLFYNQCISCTMGSHSTWYALTVPHLWMPTWRWSNKTETCCHNKVQIFIHCCFVLTVTFKNLFSLEN